MGQVSLFCFFASYAVALGLELWHQFRPRPVFRLLGLGFAFAGLLAQTIYLYDRKPSLEWPSSWLLLITWILAIFYASGSFHYRRVAWGVFVLPLILGLLGLAVLALLWERSQGVVGSPSSEVHSLWRNVHEGLLLLASIGVCIAFLASLMYLYHSSQLRSKTPPGKGLRLMSLERLESMNRRAIYWAFPLLTGGILTGVLLLIQGSQRVTWTDRRVLSTAVLWFVFAVLLLLRYSRALRGRQAAFLTIAAFVLLLCCVAISHDWLPVSS